MKHVRISDHLVAEVEAIKKKEDRSFHYVANQLMEEALNERARQAAMENTFSERSAKPRKGARK